jgi:hypothetical protein
MASGDITVNNSPVVWGNTESIYLNEIYVRNYIYIGTTFGGTNFGYVFGGYTGPAQNQSVTNSIQVFPFASGVTNALTGLSLISGPRQNQYSSQNKSFSYSIGGYNAAASPVVLTQGDRMTFPAISITGSVANLSAGRAFGTGCSSKDYGYNVGGWDATNSVTDISRVPFSSVPTTAASVGALTVSRYRPSGASSDEYGYASGGYSSTPTTGDQSVIERFPFAVPLTNAGAIGNIATARQIGPSGVSSPYYGYIPGGNGGPTFYSTIETFPFATQAALVTTIGNLTIARYEGAGQSSTTHGYYAGGWSGTAVLGSFERFPFASLSVNAASVGNLVTAVGGAAGTHY